MTARILKPTSVGIRAYRCKLRNRRLQPQNIVSERPGVGGQVASGKAKVSSGVSIVLRAIMVWLQLAMIASDRMFSASRPWAESASCVLPAACLVSRDGSRSSHLARPENACVRLRHSDEASKMLDHSVLLPYTVIQASSEGQ